MVARIFSLSLLLLVVGSSQAENKQVYGTARSSNKGGGEGYSQQYHYSSPGHHQQHGWTYAGLSFDLGSGLFIGIGAIVFLLASISLWQLWEKKDDGGWGWSGSGSGGGGGGGYRSLNLASVSEKVLNGLEKMYQAYEKDKI